MSDLTTLIDRVRGGDRAAYAGVVERFQDMAVGYASSQLGGDRHLAEDVAQEAFLQAYVDLGKLREVAAFPGWFRRIVHKHCDRFRRRQRLHLVPLDTNRWQARVEPPTDGLEAKDRRRMLADAMRRLPDDEREVVSLHYLGQHTQAEVAAFLEVPVTTVNNRMHSARQHLRQELLDMAEQGSTQAQEGGLAARVQEQIEAMASLHGSLAAPIQKSLSDALGTDVEVRVVAVDHQLGLLAIREFPSPCCTYAFEPVPGQRRICFDVHMELAACIVGRQVGHGGHARVSEIGLQIGQDEWSRINPVAKPVMGAVVALWDDVVDMEIGEPQVETNPLYVMDSWIGAQDPMFHVRFEVIWDGRTSRIDLCYPAPSLAAGLAQLQTAT